MSSMEQNDESAAAIQQQRRSVDRKPQHKLMKDNFQFYHTWSPNSLEEIDMEYGTVDDSGNTTTYPIVVAPPNYGPLQKPPPLSPRQKRYHLKSLEQANTQSGNDESTTTFMKVRKNHSGKSTESSPPALNNTRLKQSLNSLLTTPALDPLFDDDEGGQKLLQNDDSYDDNFVQPREIYHSDDTITSWIWKPEQPDNSKSAECSFINTLERGRAVHGKEPLLCIVSCSTVGEIESDGPSKSWMASTNLNLLHKAIDINVDRNDVRAVNDSNIKMESSRADSYTLYQARHPSLAPLINVENLANDANLDAQSILSIFDITPTHHQSLSELLRTGEFLSKPLFPKVEGHVLECMEDSSKIHHQFKRRKPLAWLNSRNEALDNSLCRCHKIFDANNDDWEVVEVTPATAQTSANSEGILDQVPITTRSQQFNLGDAEKWPLRERRLKRYQVGTTYRADVADLRIRFLALQLFHAVEFCHSRGITLGDQLSPDKIFVQDDGWIRIVPPITWKQDGTLSDGSSTAELHQSALLLNNRSSRKDWRAIFHRQHERLSDSNCAFASNGYKIVPYIGYGDTPTMQWQKGLLTNLAYLMLLNAAAGRTAGSQHNPPMLPWVTNFAGEIDLNSDTGDLLLERSPYWRDLSKSKFRLTKGDDQLDHTYLNLRHHVPETLSDITYTVYKARMLPIQQLRKMIRDEFIAEHYPDSMQKLYEWSPDEATIEFFVPTEPCPFRSVHEQMSDLSLPTWCKSKADFINYHRSLLESDHVSKHLHLWIDLTFGEALAGERAVKEKNFPLYCVRKLNNDHLCQGNCHSSLSGASDEKDVRSESSTLKSFFVQLFAHRHPERHSMLRNAITPRINATAEEQKQITDTRKEHRSQSANQSAIDLNMRRKRDISMIGVILKDCYNSARVIPSSEIQTAIDSLLCGNIELHHSLNDYKHRNAVPTTLFSFPKHLKDTYSMLSRAQLLSFQRLPREEDSDDNIITFRSTGLELAWNLIRSIDGECFRELPASSIGLLYPSIVHPLSGDYMVENYTSSRPFSSYSENLCNYLIKLSHKVPGIVLLPTLLKLLQTSSDHVDITEQLSKVFLSRELIGAIYSASGGEYFISKTCRFLLKQLCSQEEENVGMLDRNTVGVFFTSLLAQDDVLGTSICCRYVIPLLMDNLELCSNRRGGNAIVKSLKSLLPFLSDDAIGVLICKKILRKIVPKVLSQDNILDAVFLTELVLLLQHCLRHLDSKNIVKNFFSTNAGSICDVLSSSLAWILSSKESDVEEDNKCCEALLKEACVLVCRMFQRIERNQLDDTLLPLLDSFCCRVNDFHLNNVLNKSVLPRDGEERNEILSLVGVKEANAMFLQAREICEERVLKTSCPSLAEFLAFLNPPVEDADRVADIKEDLPLENDRNANDPRSNSDGIVSLYKSISLSGTKKLRELSDGFSIEMLSPKELGQSNDSGAKESAITKKKSRLERKKSSSSEEYMNGSIMRKTKDKLDLVWLLGLHKQDKEERSKYSWRPRMMLSAKLEIQKLSQHDNPVHVTCMKTNQSESLLASGTNDGELLLFDLKCHPPTLRCRHRFHNMFQDNDSTKSIKQVEFFDVEKMLVCNGGLHLFDVENQFVVTSLSSRNTFYVDQGCKPWCNEEINAFTMFPRGTGTSEILDGSMGDICAISSAYLYGIDMRCNKSITSSHRFSSHRPCQPDALFKRVTWHTGVATNEAPQYANTTCMQEKDSSFDFTCVTSHCGSGDWIGVGSGSGHIHIFDRRQGKLLACWRAHQKAIVYIESISRHKVMSVSADKTAVLWNIMSSPPQKINSIYNIPGKEHSMNIVSHYFREDGLVSVPGGDLILCAATGRKTVFMPMKQPNHDDSMFEVRADRIVISDCEGNRISSSEKLCISSVALLPCRQLVLLGCEGEIHVCV